VSIIVGIDCNDCVILAATGPAPRSSAGRSETAGSLIGGLRAVAGKAVVGFSGPEELGREMTATLERYLAERDPREVAPEAHQGAVGAALRQPVGLAAAMSRALEGLPGGGVSEAGLAVGEMLIALPGKGRHALFVVNGECVVTLVRRGSSCAAIGQGKHVAEAFLRFLQRLLWREGKPTRAAGQFAAYWTARHVTDIEGGSGRLIQVVRFSPGAGEAADIVRYGDRVIASLRRAVDAGIDEIRSEIKRRVLIDFEDLQDEPPSAVTPPLRKRVPEVRVTLGTPKSEERKPKW
jgi:hypothetical protein